MASKQGRRDLYKGIGRERERETPVDMQNAMVILGVLGWKMVGALTKHGVCVCGLKYAPSWFPGASSN